MMGIKDQNDPQILPKRAYKNALSIKGGIPFFEHEYSYFSAIRYMSNVCTIRRIKNSIRRIFGTSTLTNSNEDFTKQKTAAFIFI